MPLQPREEPAEPNELLTLHNSSSGAYFTNPDKSLSRPVPLVLGTTMTVLGPSGGPAEVIEFACGTIMLWFQDWELPLKEFPHAMSVRVRNVPAEAFAFRHWFAGCEQ